MEIVLLEQARKDRDSKAYGQEESTMNIGLCIRFLMA